MKELAAIDQSQNRLVIHQEPNPLAGTPAYMLQLAVEQGADLAKLEKLMDLQERWEATEARKAFLQAMAAFKASAPDILKNKHVSFQTQKGKTDYWHATLDNVVDSISAAMSPCGLSFSWDIDDGAQIRVTCIVSHVLGHEKRVSMSAPPDDSGGKNFIQQKKSTVTYLERATLLAATGLAEKGQDDDGESAVGAGLITDSQAADLKALAEEVNADIAKFLRYMGAAEIGAIKSKDYNRAVSALEKKRKAS